jgi:TolB-like protein
MTDSETIGGTPSPDMIRDAVDRVVVSEVFGRSPQLGAFLRFVVEAVLRGKGDRIKAYTIGVEVLRRDVKFDPQIDPIVRVEATRLRRALERYYAGPGADDLVIIDLPRGSYVPTFRRREPDNGDVGHPLSPGVRWLAMMQRRPMLAAGAAAVLVLAMLAGSLVWRGGSPEPAGIAVREAAAHPAAEALPPGNGMPTIYIEPLQVTGAPSPGDVTPTLLYGKIYDAFARFDTVNVVQGAGQPVSTAGSSGEAAPSAALRADYRLSGAIEYRDAQTSVLFRLIDTAEGNVVWSRLFERISAADDGITEKGIVVSLANALLQSYGVIRARDRSKHLASNTGDPRYRCILEAADAVRSMDPTVRDRARDCLQRLTALDPSFAVGFAFLAITHNREFVQEYGERPRDPLALDKALKAARRAIELQPEDSRAYLALFVVLFNRRDIPDAIAAAEKCIALNRYDMLALGEYGGRLILSGEVEKGLSMMRRAGEYGAIRPNWHYFYLFVGSYLTGDMTKAARHASHIVAENYAFGWVAKAISATAAGDAARARQAVDRLTALQPAWREDPRAELARGIPDVGIVERLARDLAAADRLTQR